MNAIQLRLIELGFLPSPTDKDKVRVWQKANGLDADGIIGDKSTKAAVKNFQKQHGLGVDGVVGPKTLPVLGLDKAKTDVRPGATVPSLPWMDVAISKLGLHEGYNNKTLAEFLRSDGHALGDPAKLPWCGDFVETSLKLGVPGIKVPENPYWALNWAKWGEPVEPQYGAILAFERSGGGHVGFYVGENSTSYLVLGGNQSNKVSKAPVAKSQLRGSRMPPGWGSKYDMTRFVIDESEKALDSDQMQ